LRNEQGEPQCIARRIDLYFLVQAFTSIQLGNKVFNFLQRAVDIIAQLKFACWWNKYDARTASGWKTDHKAKMTEGMSQAEAKRAGQQFKKATDGRNITFRLYQKVCQ
jgi:hypothetical protein